MPFLILNLMAVKTELRECRKIMNGQNFSIRVIAENLIRKFRLVLSYDDPFVIYFGQTKTFYQYFNPTTLF